VLRVIGAGVLVLASAIATAQGNDPLPPPGGELVLEDFEGCDVGKTPTLWTKWGKPEGMTIEATRDGEAREGRAPPIAMTLSGKIVKGGRDAMQVEAARDLYLPALATEVVVRLTGDAPNCRFHVRLRDAEGETSGYTFPCPENDQPREARLTVDERQAEYHYAGNNDGRATWPLVLQGVGVAATETAAAGADFRVSVEQISAVIPECKPTEVESCEGDECPFGLAGENLGQTKLSVGPDEVLKTLTCTWLDYAWGPGDPRPNSYAELVHRTPLEGGEGTLFAWIRGDRSGMVLTFRFQDAKGEFWQITQQNGFMLWTGWRCIPLDLVAGDRRSVFSSWAGDGVLDPPFTFHSVIFDDWTGPTRLDEIPPSPAQGRVAVGPIWFVPWAAG